MAHYVAELIQGTVDSTDEDRDVKLKACSDAILTLWEHRHQLPHGSRPFEDLQPIFETLRGLDPENSAMRYFRAARLGAQNDDEIGEGAKWLQIANSVEATAKVLISYCLARASETALNKTKDWVTLAEKAGVGGGLDSLVVRILIGERALTEERSKEDEDRRRICDRLERLKLFRQLAEGMESELRAQLVD